MDMMEVRRRVMMSMVANGIKLPDGCEIGTFSPNEDSYTITIQHNFGEIPKIALCIAVPNCSFEDIPSKAIMLEYFVVQPKNGVLWPSTVVDYEYYSYDNSKLSNTYHASSTATEVTFVTGSFDEYVFKAGVNYVYILIK